ncbi:DUF1349 domain-containing protein [Aureibacter tunicatorum]|uniref:DUF1349 domain-containing protein n=1 Tax=Aureibacter tunicatorum TaxID=866807 RepID=A0AAE3XR42_9BACT|nr:DUF1349 domain-containing protein [Aureibacter tunicatorum]MDR6239899.1 hypothetical protein [Aureibacter tunicatorum]BDD04374.1 hypothetical protein AUTU_18570 [Aureibacter tunicatorum]
MKKNIFIAIIFIMSLNTTFGQSLNSLNWLNEPEQWNISDNRLTLQVTPQTDFWNKTHYGFTVNDGPFLFAKRSGEFEVTAKLTGKYKTRFDQMGLMFRIDNNHWIKTGIEYVDGVYNFSTVHTINHSSWSVVALKEKPKSIWIKAIRKVDAIEIFYSLDGTNYQMSNIVYFPEHRSIEVGMMAASPDGDGFEATFEDFKIKHTPDSRRLEWLKNNQE